MLCFYSSTKNKKDIFNFTIKILSTNAKLSGAAVRQKNLDLLYLEDNEDYFVEALRRSNLSSDENNLSLDDKFHIFFDFYYQFDKLVLKTVKKRRVFQGIKQRM